MSDPELKEIIRASKRETARELASGVDNPVIARIRATRLKFAREAGYDVKQYAENMRKRQSLRETKAVTREEPQRLHRQNETAEAAKAVAQKGGKGA